MRKPSIVALAIVVSFSALLSCHKGSSSNKPVLPADKPVVQTRSGAAEIQAEDMRAHVELLASDEYQGRETLEPGYEKAAVYIANQFRSYGLRPYPEQDDFVVPYALWQQGYDMGATSLAITPTKALEEANVELGTSAAPFRFSDDGELDAEVVFAGYGITAPELDYDDYSGLDVAGKWVLVLRHAPGYRDEASVFFGGERKTKAGKAPKPKGTKGKPAPDPRQYSAFMTKALNAQEHGAKGMLLVSGPATREMPDDLRIRGRLQVPLTAKEKAEREAAIAKAKARRAAMMVEEKARREKSKEASKGKAKSKGKRKARGKGKARALAGAKGKQAPGVPLAPPEEKKLLAFHISPATAIAMLSDSGKTLVELQAQVDAGTPASAIQLSARAKASVKTRKDPAMVSGKNIVGYIKGSDRLLSKELVVIGGHFDHLGAFSEQGDMESDTIFNGADDNASGTSGVLELAQAFASADKAPKRSMVFIAFSGEEKGLLGSRALAKQGPIDTERVVFMLNLDMIGRNNEEPVEFVGGDYATRIREIAERANQSLSLPLSFGEYAANSDHHAFFEKEVPVAFFFTGLHDDYHGLADHADKLDYDRMEQIVKLGFALASEVANGDEAPVFIHKLMWLGASVQNQTEAGGTVSRITEVEKDSRAAAAGLIVGDLVSKIDAIAIAEGMGAEAEAEADDAKSAGSLLRDISPGSTVALEILRGGQPQVISLERAKRGYLGIFPGSVSDEDRQKFSLDKSEGIFIARALEGAPAFKSGLRDGDIITKLAGHSVNRQTLMKRLSRIGAGESITVQIIRDGKRLEMPLTLGEPPQR